MKHTALALSAALLFFVSLAHADHQAQHTEKVVYKGEVTESTPVSGSVSDRVRREWYTFNASAFTQITFTATSEQTTLPPNIGVLKGSVKSGTKVEVLEAQGGFLGLTNNASAQTISLTIRPDFTGVISVYVARFIDGQEGTYSLSATVNKLPFFTSLSSDTAGALSNYSFAIQAAGEGTITYATTALPSGLTLNGNLIQGIPSVTGFFSITITASNAFGSTDQFFSLTINGPVIQATVNDPGTGLPVPTTTVFSDTPLTLTALVATGGPTFSWDFGDSTSATGNPVSKTYTVATGEQTFFVALTTDNGGTILNSTLTLIVSAPITQTTNVSQDQSVRNPIDGISITVQKTMGGVIGLAVNPESTSALSRALDDFEISTAYEGTFGIPTRTSVTGARPVAKFTTAGIVVAETTVTPTRAKNPTGSTKPRKARKTLAISESELGTAPSGLVDNRSSKAIEPMTLKAKLGLGAVTKPDQVSFKGNLLLPMGITPGTPQQVSVAIGNVIDTVTIDAKGKAQLPSSANLIKKFSIKLPKLKGIPATAGNEKASFDITYQAFGLVGGGFDTEGVSADSPDLDAAKRTAPRKIQVLLKFGGVAYEVPADVTMKVAPKNDSAQLTLVRASR